MLKLTEAADLEKASNSLANYFAKRLEELNKTHAFHAAVAAHHDAMKAAHTEYAAHHKATGDGLANDHELKGHMAKGHTHHTQMAAHHEAVAKAHSAHADSMKTEIDALKTISADWGSAQKAAAPGAVDVVDLATGGSTLDQKVTALSAALMSKAFESLNNSPAIAEKVQQIVLEQVEKAVGGKLLPTEVRQVIPDNPAGLRAIPRAGSPAAKVEGVPLEFEAMFKLEDSAV